MRAELQSSTDSPEKTGTRSARCSTPRRDLGEGAFAEKHARSWRFLPEWPHSTPQAVQSPQILTALPNILRTGDGRSTLCVFELAHRWRLKSCCRPTA